MNRTLPNLRQATRTVFFIVCFCAGAVQLIAQDKKITGTVKSGDDNTGLPGASIVVEGTSIGTVTDSDGRYTIEVPSDAMLVFSSIGYKSQKITVSNQSVIDLTLELDAASLDEVVVVGYATVERRDLTSSVSSVNAKQLKDIPINSAAQALAGRLAGVQVTSSEGSPNAQVTIRVRGGGSITQDNTPLYVVDGVQVENALSVLAPQDIQSIDVLKDASATAIYGARGANGVVIITTKGGHAMKTTVNFNSLIGVRELANKLDVMNPYDFVSYQYERSRGSAADQNSFNKAYGNFDDLENYKQVPNVDWQDKMFGRNALMTTNNLSVQGGTAETQFNLSVSSNTEQGIMLTSDFDRKLVNFRFDHQIGKKVKTGFNVRYNRTIVNGAGTSNAGSSSVNNLRQSVKYRPLLFPGQTTDTYDPAYASETAANSLSLVNPILLAQQTYQKDYQNTTNLNGYVAIDITKYLTFRTTIGFDIFNDHIDNFYDTITSNAKQQGGGKPIASITLNSRDILNNSNILTFNAGNAFPSFAKDNKLDVLLGHEIYETLEKANYTESHGFPVGITPDLALNGMANGVPQTPPTSSLQPTHLLSFFSRVNYSHKDRYLLTLTMRGDGSSKFSQGHKWGYFPSASAAWRISDENFMQSMQSTFSNLKLRASYGAAGNNRINNFQYLSQFVADGVFYDANNVTIGGYRPTGLANNDIKWETTISRNIGLDVGVFNNKLQLSVDVYKNTTNDLLLLAQVPPSSGYPSQTQNIGSTSNRGVEVQLSATPVNAGNFLWTANFNISFNQNKIESLGGLKSFLTNSGWGGTNVPADYAVIPGQSVGIIWGLVTDGFYKVDDFNYADGKYVLKDGVVNDKAITGNPQPGVIKFKDLDGDGSVDLDHDRQNIGNTTPKFFGGLNQQFTYKNLDLSIFVNFQYGNKILNANKLEFTSGYTPNSNMLSIMNNRWRSVDANGQVVTDPTALAALNQNATIWAPPTTNSSFFVHSWAVEDGSFLRINNVTLGYTVPTPILSKIKITKLRFYGTVNNLAVFTKYSGYDPDVNVRRATPLTPGVDYSAYPRSRAYIFGLNLSF